MWTQNDGYRFRSAGPILTQDNFRSFPFPRAVTSFRRSQEGGYGRFIQTDDPAISPLYFVAVHRYPYVKEIQVFFPSSNSNILDIHIPGQKALFLLPAFLVFPVMFLLTPVKVLLIRLLFLR